MDMSSSSSVPRRGLLGGTVPYYYQQQPQHHVGDAASDDHYDDHATVQQPGIVGDASGLLVPPSRYDEGIIVGAMHVVAVDQPLQYGRCLGEGTFGVVMEVGPRLGDNPWPCGGVAKVFKEPTTTIEREVIANTRLAGSPAAARFLGRHRNILFFERLRMDLHTWAKGNPSLEEIKCVLRGVLQAVMRIHDRGVYHQDIKEDNVMVEVRKDGKIVVRFIDFGLSEVADHDSRNSFDVCLSGTLCCMPPEKLARMARSTRATVTRRDLVNADMWAVGVLAHVLLFGEYPFGRDRDRRAVLKQMDWLSCYRYDDDQKDGQLDIIFVMGLLNPNCAQRWTPSQALSHAFLATQ